MNTSRTDVPEAAALPGSSHAVEAVAGTLGALGGAATGAAMAGPVGALAGALIGAAMGASSGWAADKHSEEQAEVDAALDDEIGVGSGSIGVSTLQHPPSTLNAPSAAAAGASSGSLGLPDDAEGPMQAPPE